MSLSLVRLYTRDIHTVNPCIVSQNPVILKAGQPLTLHYLLVVHDGEARDVPLAKIFKGFAR